MIEHADFKNPLGQIRKDQVFVYEYLLNHGSSYNSAYIMAMAQRLLIVLVVTYQ